MRALVLVLVLGLGLAGCARPYAGPVHVVAAAPFRAVLAERGVVGSETEIAVAAPFSAKLDTLVPEGTLVKVGQPVGKLAADEPRDEWAKARLRLTQMRLALPLTRLEREHDRWKKRQEAANADLDLKIAKLKLSLLVRGRAGTQIVEAAESAGALEAERAILAKTLPEAEALLAKGYVSEQEVRRMRGRLAQLGAERKAVQARLATLEAGPRREEIQLERLKVEQAASARQAAKKRVKAAEVEARLEIESAQSDVDRAAEREAYRAAQVRLATLRAPAAGIVIYEEIWTGGSVEKLKPGDAVDNGSALVKIADPGHQVVRCEVQEAAAAHLKVGMPVRCLFDAYPGLALPATLRWVAPVAGAKLEGDLARVQAIAVTVALAKPDKRLRPGMSANLEFVLAEEPGRLAVPTEAITKDAQGAAVQVLVGLQPQRRAVTLGQANERETVVLTGLVAGDRVAVGAP